MAELPDFKRVEECRSGAWEAIGPFANLADPSYVKYFRETMMTALKKGAEKIRNYQERRQQEAEYLLTIRQRF